MNKKSIDLDEMDCIKKAVQHLAEMGIDKPKIEVDKLDIPFLAFVFTGLFNGEGIGSRSVFSFTISESLDPCEVLVVNGNVEEALERRFNEIFSVNCENLAKQMAYHSI